MILICFGTRPEYIKVKSLIDNMQNIKTCFTGQHKDLLNDISVDIHLDFTDYCSNNRLNEIIMNILSKPYIFDNMDYVLVQGDTTTALAIAISAFNSSKKVIHLEAGLRTNDITDPFPEEMNRQLISRIANIHLCPTENNRQNLINENIKENIYVVGNTGLDNIDKTNCIYDNIILVTLHRRNNLELMEKWLNAVEEIAINNPEYKFILPLHPNPHVQKHKHILKKVEVIEPMNHIDTINLIKKCKFLISDSGGIQEEASFLNKKIIICRKSTERPEILGKHGILCETYDKLPEIFDNYKQTFMVNEKCPFGDGYAYKKILDIFKLHKIV